jgi:myo-inositol-1(or 4)-monophosphatase
MLSDLNLAISAAKKAGDLILNYFKSDYEIKDKGFNNPVTTADHEADQCIKEILMGNRPDYGWLSEETVDSFKRLEKKKVWIVDPLDGTKEFIEGVANFVVSIGLVQEGYPIIGVLYNPITKELFTAAKNEGAYLNGISIKCSLKESLSDMSLLISRSELRKGLWSPYKKKFFKLKPIGSVAYKLGLTAANKADLFASLRPKNEWDICAGNCIINEAGGKLIDLNGKHVIFNRKTTRIQPGLIAGEKKAVDKILKILK